MDYNNKKVLISAIYRSPNQNKSEFDLFLANLEQLLGEINKRKPYLSIITGDFNAILNQSLKHFTMTKKFQLFHLF